MIWELMKKENNKTYTENDALTFKSSNSKVLDLFAMGGSLRTRNEEDIRSMINKALAEDKNLAIKCLFYLRDIRGGQGERRTFREGLKVLSECYPNEMAKLLHLIPEYGRWDDIFYVRRVSISEMIFDEMKKDNSLLFKWMPSENAGKKSKELATKLRIYLGLSSKKYRKLLSEKRRKLNLVESKMSKTAWGFIDYEKLPSKAGLKYRKAFLKHDEEGYKEFLNDVKTGKSKINTKALYPYEIVSKARHSADDTLEVIWNNLPDYTRGDEKAIVVADVSGSMIGTPMDISVSLAMYFAERNKGIFKDKFITFSGSPELQEIKGKTLKQKIMNLESSEWEMNTNIQKVFDLILNTAVDNNVKEKDLPSTIYIISDMEFDEAVTGSTNFELIKKKYEKSGYKMPTLVFWNVDSRQNNIPVLEDEKGVVLVSGASASTFKLAVGKVTPLEFMMTTLNQKRYDLIDEALGNI